MINREIILFQNHPEQFLISLIIDCSIFHFREIVKRCGTFASNIYPYHFFMSIDDAKHGLELEKRHVTIAPVGDGILLSQYILVDGYVNRLMYKFTSLRRPSLVMVYLCLTVEQHPPIPVAAYPDDGQKLSGKKVHGAWIPNIR